MKKYCFVYFVKFLISALERMIAFISFVTLVRMSYFAINDEKNTSCALWFFWKFRNLQENYCDKFKYGEIIILIFDVLI